MIDGAGLVDRKALRQKPDRQDVEILDPATVGTIIANS
jgi:hypothetical protein